MAVHGGYPDGAPCWGDVTAPDPAAARRFYGALFGWTFTAAGVCLLDGAPVAALVEPAAGVNLPPMWSTYLATSRLAETAARVTGAGGTLLREPFAVGEDGRLALVLDPAGALVHLWQGAKLPGAERRDEPGAPAWRELWCPDGRVADAFYQALFGYDEQRQVGDGTDFNYTVWRIGGERVAGRYEAPPEVEPHWMSYFAVADTDATAALARGLGGGVRRGPWDCPHGRMCVLADPAGAVFTVAGPTGR